MSELPGGKFSGPIGTELQYITRAVFVPRLVETIYSSGPWTPPAPLSRRERLAEWFEERKRRVALAWRVLRGDDIHEDCSSW